ncbi:MAG TPA: SDR family NAD(P)-dependent oxidoreductase, partial [Acidimicrobiales bacterium]|nr:SDR family NAD(P)-dependent oxidoreductase [Acidimicrobiales bacterium]
MADDGLPFRGRVVLVTGGARGQGRSHALEFARLGADVAVCDLCRDVPSVGYPMASESDLAETVAMVEGAGRRARSGVVDVRDLDAVVAFTDGVVTDLGAVDVLVANAGVAAVGSIG